MTLLKHFQTILKLYPYIWPKDWFIRCRFLISAFLLLLTVGLNVGVPLILRQVINAISSQPSTLFMAETLLIAYGITWMFSKITDQLRLVAINRVVERGMRLLCLSVFNHLLALSFRFHSTRKTGALLSVIDRAQFAFWPFFGVVFVILPTLIEVIIATIILIYLYGWIYGLILAVTLIVYMIFSIYGSEWSMRAQRVANDKSAEVSASIVDSLLNYETIRHFVNQKYERTKCDNLLAQREDASTKQHARGEYVLLGQGIIMGVGIIVLTWLSGNQVMTGALRVSDFILINVYLLQFMAPLGQFGYVFRDMNEGLTNMEDVMTILEEKPDIQDSPTASIFTLKKGVITFDKVNFGYDVRRPILHEVSFEIPAKKTVAIVGASGAGKSTIAKLLFRYDDVTGGRILIDDQDIRDVTQASLQSFIGVVPQHTALFNETLRYNLAYGRPEATDADLQKAIENAHLDAFIASLPDGLNTIVGEHGLKLSGGERQRVAIARVLLKNPAILIFDEATSSLDTKTEHLIQTNIEEISRNATTLIIAHRLSTVVHADQIIVLDHGQIVEKGTHDELLKQNDVYAQLWKKQIHEQPDKQE
jgi:ABC-type transport system involved in Fe-S cluster assembly fused permease/ATPase subunit